MRGLRAILIGITYSSLAIFIIKLGYDGLKINIACKRSSTHNIYEVYKNSSNLDGTVLSIAVDSSIYIAQIEDQNHIFQFYPRDSSSKDIRVVYEYQSKVHDTVFGVFQSLVSEYPELLLESDDFSNMYIIKHTPNPRKWYWNVLLIALPLLFLKAFMQAMYRMFKGAKYDPD